MYKQERIRNESRKGKYYSEGINSKHDIYHNKKIKPDVSKFITTITNDVKQIVCKKCGDKLRLKPDFDRQIDYKLIDDFKLSHSH